jgi:hypothetical protein
MSKERKPKIITPNLQDKLATLPDLFFLEDMDSLPKAKLLAIMDALDETSDFINDYLTDSNYVPTTTCTDAGLDKMQ